eukprot:365891-Chlamydomonas_euryale.AAC.4
MSAAVGVRGLGRAQDCRREDLTSRPKNGPELEKDNPHMRFGATHGHRAMNMAAWALTHPTIGLPLSPTMCATPPTLPHLVRL